VALMAIAMAMAVMPVQAATWRPVVLMHGLFATSEAMSHAQGWIEADFPGIHVLNVEIGDGKLDSLLMDMNVQVDKFAAAVRADPLLVQGFNLIGHSQGGLVTRGYIERYNDPPVYNYNTWAGPHAGVYGVPDFNLPILDELFSSILESTDGEIIESFISFGAYWKDPYNLMKYMDMSIFLADLNNERQIKNSTYKQNIMSLNTMALEYSTIDTIVVPNTSPLFQFFAANESSTVVPLRQSDFYIEDWLGIRALDEAGRLQLLQTNCDHQDFPRDTCKNFYDEFTRPLLNNTLA